MGRLIHYAKSVCQSLYKIATTAPVQIGEMDGVQGLELRLDPWCDLALATAYPVARLGHKMGHGNDERAERIRTDYYSRFPINQK